LQRLRTAVEFSGKKFVETEEIENGVRDSNGASELLAPAREGDALFAFFTEVDDYVGRVVCFVSFDFNVFFFERLEVSSAGETREPCFDGVPKTSPNIPRLE